MQSHSLDDEAAYGGVNAAFTHLVCRQQKYKPVVDSVGELCFVIATFILRNGFSGVHNSSG